jgi:RimJ/RimL family protein N-acetyltransferase
MRWIRDPQPLAAITERATGLAAPWQGLDGEWLALAVVPNERPAMVGIVVCRVTVAANATMEIGYRLQPDVHRRGYAFEACTALCGFLFAEIGVRKLVAWCVAENEPSWRLMEKLGMQREARFREYTQLDGQWRDEFVYGLLAREWPPRQVTA